MQRLIAIGLLGALAASARGELSPRPNFVVILAEAQGWASSSVQMDDQIPDSKSSLARTPALEKLAAAGTRFADFYAASPRCTPTRAALFTGRSPAALHITFVNEGNGGRETSFSETGSRFLPPKFTSELAPAETTIAALLQKAGYATAHFGKWHVGRTNPKAYGFDESDGPTNNGGPENLENPNPTEAFGITVRGNDFLSRQAQAGKPFYLQLSHYPGRGGTDARPETYAAVRSRVQSDRDQRQVGAVAVAEDMDASIGQVLARLDELGLAGKTYVIYTADHGAMGRSANGPLMYGKGSVWEGGVRVPCIVRGPGVKAGACTHVRASTVDLFPTIAALAHLPGTLPRELEGGNLVPLLTGQPAAAVKRPREEFVVHFPHYDRDGQGPSDAVWLGQDKLIREYEGTETHLFNLENDFAERRDLFTSRAQDAAALERRLTDYLASVHAQFLAPNPAYDPTKIPPPPPERKPRPGSRSGAQ